MYILNLFNGFDLNSDVNSKTCLSKSEIIISSLWLLSYFEFGSDSFKIVEPLFIKYLMI